METISLFTSVTDDGTEFRVIVEAEAYDSKLKVKLSIQEIFSKDVIQADVTGEIIFDISHDNLKINPPSIIGSAYALCLTSCGLGGLASEILECRKNISKNSNIVTSRNLLNCLRQKGHKISKSLITCLIGCIPSLA